MSWIRDMKQQTVNPLTPTAATWVEI